MVAALPAAAVMRTRPERTVRVVGVDVGAGGVPALDRTIHPPAEALLAAGAHGDAQHSATADKEEGHQDLDQNQILKQEDETSSSQT